MGLDVIQPNMPLQYRTSQTMVDSIYVDNNQQQEHLNFIAETLIPNGHVLTGNTDYIFLLGLRQYGIPRINNVIGGGRWDSEFWDSDGVLWDSIQEAADISPDSYKKICTIILNKTYKIFNISYLMWLVSFYTEIDPMKIIITPVVISSEFVYNVIVPETELSLELKSIVQNYGRNDNGNIFNIPINVLINFQVISPSDVLRGVSINLDENAVGVNPHGV